MPCLEKVQTIICKYTTDPHMANETSRLSCTFQFVIYLPHEQLKSNICLILPYMYYASGEEIQCNMQNLT